MLGLLLLIMLVMALFGSVPIWPHSRDWGYGPSGGVGAILLIIVILILFGHL